jgi:thiol-disulfide isomerase/thioredoxin
MNRKRVISIVILWTLALVNSGCIGTYLHQNENIEKKVIKKETPPTINKNNITSPTHITPTIECKEDTPSKESNCNRGIISSDDLNNIPKKGDIHTLKSIRGKIIHIAESTKGFTFPEYQGKVIILEMFGKDCPHCLNQIPTIEKIRRIYKGRLEVIAVQAQERMSTYVARGYINQHGIQYPIIEGEDAMNLQLSIQETFGWTGILPYTLVIQDGVVKYIYNKGEIAYKVLEQDISELF